uniref:HMA domain-containing protein n=1 Tax=Oryza meridionalis TaxID=40149 RepID=A0A0E0CBS9_9ORYZ
MTELQGVAAGAACLDLNFLSGRAIDRPSPPNLRDPACSYSSTTKKKKKAKANKSKQQLLSPPFILVAVAAAAEENEIVVAVAAIVVVLRVPLHCKGCTGKVKKHISKMEGITSLDIDIATKTSPPPKLGPLPTAVKVTHSRQRGVPSPALPPCLTQERVEEERKVEGDLTCGSHCFFIIFSRLNCHVSATSMPRG